MSINEIKVMLKKQNHFGKVILEIQLYRLLKIIQETFVIFFQVRLRLVRMVVE